MIIRRSGETIWNAEDTRTAVTDGLSLDRLHLRAGDEIYVPQEKHFNWMSILQYGSIALSAAVAIITLSRR
jgi:hypothetical protein